MKIQSLFQKRADWFDIFEFLHEVGASQKLLSNLAEDDLTAVTQCQVFLDSLEISFFLIFSNFRLACTVLL